MTRPRASKHTHGKSEAAERPATARALRRDGSVLARNVRARRRALGFTQEQLAELAGLHPVHIIRLEAGGSNPKLSTLVAVALALRTTSSELLKPSAR